MYSIQYIISILMSAFCLNSKLLFCFIYCSVWLVHKKLNFPIFNLGVTTEATVQKKKKNH